MDTASDDKGRTLSCVDCGTQNCKFKDRSYPDFCLTTNLRNEDLEWAMQRYDENNNHNIMVASAEVEYEGYCQWTRVQEIMEFARKINAVKIGIANCIGLIREARIFARILRANGFEPYSVICKVAGKAKTSVGIPEKCESIGAAMCNPILQARLLNEAKTDLNVVIGLCVGHDSLFYKYSDAYVTTLVTKDRVTGNNPAAALYTAESYYRKKFGLDTEKSKKISDSYCSGFSEDSVLNRIQIKNLHLEKWKGEGIRNSFGNKMLVNCEGKPMFAELAVANKLIKDGWNARWLTTYGKGKMSPLLLTEWKDVQYKEQKHIPIEDSHINLLLNKIADKNNKSFYGCWDIVAWKGENLIFVELKRKGKDKIRQTQIGWLKAAIECGLKEENFVIVEWDIH